MATFSRPLREPTPAGRRVARLAFLGLALGVAALAAWIPFRDCGTLLGLIREQPGSTYDVACKAKAATYLDDVRERRYLPQRLRVRSWSSGGQPGMVMGETLYASMLARRATAFSVVEARGGMGKTKLAGAIEARLCDAVPTFRVDVGQDLLPRLRAGVATGDALEAVVADLAHVAPGSPAHARLLELLGLDGWVLLVDSLDEVAVTERPQVVQALESLFARYPETLRLALFTRPPVYSDAYGLKSVHSWLSIEPLDCAAAEERVRAALGGEVGAQPFRAFATGSGLDARSRTTEACRYEHLSTYRDVNVALDVAKDLAFEAPAGFVASRAAVYGLWLDGRLRAAGLDPRTARDALTAMIAASRPATGVRTFNFALTDCRAVMDPGSCPDAAVACQKLAASRLARRIDDDHFRFDNQSLADYFLAAWIDRRLANADASADCARLEGLAPLFESSEVAGFLLGMPAGRACAVPVISELCLVGQVGEETLALIEQGLGGAGLEVVATLSGPSDAGALAPCLHRVSDRLAAPAPRAP